MSAALPPPQQTAPAFGVVAGGAGLRLETSPPCRQQSCRKSASEEMAHSQRSAGPPAHPLQDSNASCDWPEAASPSEIDGGAEAVVDGRMCEESEEAADEEEQAGEDGVMYNSDDGFSHVQEPSLGDTEVIYVREAVSVWPSRRESIEGRLTLIKQHHVMFMAWLPYTLGTLNQDGTFNVSKSGNSSSSMSASASTSDRTMYAVHPIPLSEIKAITKHTPALGWHYLCVVLVNGLTLPPLYFNNGGVRAFLSALKDHAHLIKSPSDNSTYLVNDTVDPLQRSLTSLELTDVLLGAPPPGASGTFAPLHGDLAASWCLGDGLRPPHGSYMYTGTGGGHRNISSMSMHIIDQFSRVARMARDTTSSLFVSPEDDCEGFGHLHHPLSAASFPYPAAAAALEAGVREPPWKQAQKGRAHGTVTVEGAVVAAEGSLAGEGGPSEHADTCVGSFELVDQHVDLAAASRKRARPPPLGLEDWSAFLDAEGRLKNEAGFRERVFYGGLSQGMRKEAWKFLLQLYPANSTAAERAEMAEERQREYEVLKSQWSSITPKQASSFSKWRERVSRVEKDVHRTDCSNPFFAPGGDGAPEHLAQLRAILLTYCMYNFDLGYCQGMSDLAGPILVVMQNEADAFWCFAALMDRMQSNFHTDQTGMHNQLLALQNLVGLLDPQLTAFLETRECLNFFFCFRWVLIQFKREFEFDQLLRLWEALWSRHHSDHLHLYVCVAVLEQHRRSIMREEMDFDGILKFCIDLSGKIDLDSVLRDAEVLCLYAGEAGREILAGLP